LNDVTTCLANSGSPLFSDHWLSVGTSPIKAVHIAELRTRINAQRQRFLLGLFTFTDGSLSIGSSSIKGTHITELRTALLQAYAAAGGAQPGAFTDPALQAGTTLIKLIHIQELRDLVILLEAR
jgi:hypothetical protein